MNPDQVPNQFKVSEGNMGEFEFTIRLAGFGKTPREAWEEMHSNFDFEWISAFPEDSKDIKLIKQEKDEFL